jgi:hypothetical protein
VSLHSFNSPFFPQWTNQIASVVSLYVEAYMRAFWHAKSQHPKSYLLCKKNLIKSNKKDLK